MKAEIAANKTASKLMPNNIRTPQQ